MTAAAPVSPLVRRRRGMKFLAGALAVACGVLFLLAVEQRHAIAAWRTVEAGFRSAEALWRTGPPAAASQSSASPPVAVLAATDEDIPLTGAFQPGDMLTRQSVGEVVFTAGLIRFGSGEVLHTRPLRIVQGGEPFNQGRTYSDLWGAPAEAQVELRSVLSLKEASSSEGLPLCRPDRPGAVALLHRRNRLDMMVFRQGAAPGPEAPGSAVCGVWSFRR
jgi:hypothetical protein